MIVADSTSLVIAAVLAFMLEEPRIKSTKLITENILVQAMRIVKKDPWLLRAAISKLLLFFAGFFIFRVYQPYLQQNGATVLMIAGFYMASRGGLFISFWFMGRITKRFGTAWVINWSAVLGITFLFLSLFLNNIWLLMIFFATGHVLIDLREPLFSKAMTERMESKSKATTLSLLNMLKGLLDIPLLLAVGWVVSVDIRLAIVGAIIIGLVAVIFFWSHEKEFEDIKL